MDQIDEDPYRERWLGFSFCILQWLTNETERNDIAVVDNKKKLWLSDDVGTENKWEDDYNQIR